MINVFRIFAFVKRCILSTFSNFLIFFLKLEQYHLVIMPAYSTVLSIYFFFLS